MTYDLISDMIPEVPDFLADYSKRFRNSFKTYLDSTWRGKIYGTLQSDRSAAAIELSARWPL